VSELVEVAIADTVDGALDARPRLPGLYGRLRPRSAKFRVGNQRLRDDLIRVRSEVGANIGGDCAHVGFRKWVRIQGYSNDR